MYSFFCVFIVVKRMSLSMEELIIFYSSAFGIVYANISLF